MTGERDTATVDVAFSFDDVADLVLFIARRFDGDMLKAAVCSRAAAEAIWRLTLVDEPDREQLERDMVAAGRLAAGKLVAAVESSYSELTRASGEGFGDVD